MPKEIALNCDRLSMEDDAVPVDILTRVTDKWTMWVIYVLSEGGRLRFSRVAERVEGISQKMLTKTLRQLERDGIVERTMYMEVPPRVEYELTPFGHEFLKQVRPIWRWIVDSTPIFEAARRRYDGETEEAA